MTTARRYAPEAPPLFSRYFSTTLNEFKFHAHAVRFLKETGVEGNLFNTYRLGGYLAYRLAPRLRTFVDSRTEHYPASIYHEYVRVTEMRGARPGESFHDLLERRGVDLFFGVGIPPTRPGKRFTSAHLERAPGWLLVSRSIRHGVYLRLGERNAENLRRIASYYQNEGVPFDSARGLDVMTLLRDRPDWATAHGMVPPEYPEWVRDRASGEPEVRFRALTGLGRTYALLGAYEEALEVDREAVRLRPSSQGPRRRLVYELLRMNRNRRGVAAARALLAIDPDDPLSLTCLSVAREIQRLRIDARAAAGSTATHPSSAPPEALLNRLTL